MAEKKKGKKRKEEYQSTDSVDKPSKEEFVIAKWMRNNVPIKKTKFLNHNVEYFTAKRAVDALMESKWAQGDEPFFKTREDIIDYLHLMLVHKFYHRARKVPVSESELKGKKKEKKIEPEEKEKIKEKEKVTDAESSVVEWKEKEQQPEKEKRKKKIRLDMHNDQRFVDGMDAYVWIYDPIPFHYWIIGTLLVLGAIGVCLFPLWPPSVRLGVYYLSVAAAGFLVTIIVLAVIRLVVFCLIWVCSMGKHHLWILPNLTEDVGFFASFWPLYNYEYKGKDKSRSKKEKVKKKKKDKDSDAEQESEDKSKLGTEIIQQVTNGSEDKHSEGGIGSPEGGSQVEVLGASETENLECGIEDENKELSEDELLKRKEDYLKIISKTAQERKEITANTIGQSNNKLWRQERSIRLTSSNFGGICKMKRTTHCANSVKRLLYSSFSGNQATRWGNDHEAVAKKEFEEIYNLSIEECGLFIDSQYNFLAASPDGLVGEEAIVEIKCPSSACFYTVTEAIQQRKIKFAEIKNGKVTLKRNDNYYYQIQGQLRITQRNFCYFIIWTPRELTVEKVFWDETFWKDKMERPLIAFFDYCFLPEIIDPQFPKNGRIKDLRIERL